MIDKGDQLMSENKEAPGFRGGKRLEFRKFGPAVNAVDMGELAAVDFIERIGADIAKAFDEKAERIALAAFIKALDIPPFRKNLVLIGGEKPDDFTREQFQCGINAAVASAHNAIVAWLQEVSEDPLKEWRRIDYML